MSETKNVEQGPDKRVERSKHTPAPWMIAAESGEFFVTGPDYEPLCGEANATLIAAAPYMLEALMAVLDDLGAWRGMATSTREDVIFAARKARGEIP